MCRRVALILLAVNAAVVAVAVTAFVHLEWWQAAIVLLATIAAAVLGVRYLLLFTFRYWTNHLATLAGAGGIVLRNATVQVHSVESTDSPRKLEDFDEFDSVDDDTRQQIETDTLQKNWYRIDLTIFPNPDIEESKGPWSPHSLVFLPYGTEPCANWMTRDDSIPFEKLKLVNPGNEKDDVHGPQRLLILAGIPKELTDLSIGYLGESFGRVRLPDYFERRKTLSS